MDASFCMLLRRQDLLVLVCLFAFASSPILSARQQGSGNAASNEMHGEDLEPSLQAIRKLLDNGDFDAAISRLKAIESNQPNTKAVQHELGVAYFKKGEYLPAIASFKKALEEDRDDREATQLLGLSYYLSGRPAEAIPFLEKVQSWFPRPMSMRPTFLALRTSRRRTIRTRELHLHACLMCRRIPRPRTFSLRECC